MSDEAAIEAIEDDIGTVADPSRFDQFYTSDALLYDGLAPGVCRGLGEIKAAFARQLNGVASVKTDFRERHVDVAGDLAVANSVQDITVTMEDGSVRCIACRATDVFRRIDGEWKIARQHLSYPIDPATGQGLLFRPVAQ
jgi:ketosteroid isomerase-like protein